MLCNVRIRSHPLNEQQEQITLLEGEKTLIFPFEWRGPGAIVLPWKCHSGYIMELCDKCNNCTKFKLLTEKVVRDINFFVILHHFVATK